jgi:hypothetical protein
MSRLKSAAWSSCGIDALWMAIEESLWGRIVDRLTECTGSIRARVLEAKKQRVVEPRRSSVGRAGAMRGWGREDDVLGADALVQLARGVQNAYR